MIRWVTVILIREWVNGPSVRPAEPSHGRGGSWKAPAGCAVWHLYISTYFYLYFPFRSILKHINGVTHTSDCAQPLEERVVFQVWSSLKHLEALRLKHVRSCMLKQIVQPLNFSWNLKLWALAVQSRLRLACCITAAQHSLLTCSEWQYWHANDEQHSVFFIKGVSMLAFAD